MRILLTGAQGQLGRDIIRVFSDKGLVVMGLGSLELDVTDAYRFKRVAESFHPDVILYSSAYTAVDLAEQEIDKAYAVNAFGARNAAVVANATGAKLCFISTDYVFDGKSLVPYREHDPTNPTSIYGKSKRAGEELVQTIAERYFITRTSWLYGIHGNNFVKSMLKLAKERTSIKVVSDQVGAPTYTVDLANILFDLIQSEQYGVYHASNTGECSWFEFAKYIFEIAGIDIDVVPCTTEEFLRPAPRPAYSVMDHMAIRLNGFNDLRPWREALWDFFAQYNTPQKV